MRAIKFRAWDKYSKTMYYDVQNSYDTVGEVTPNDPETHFGCYFPCEGEETYWKVMQYTGLKDKNGVEIYEGDIIQEDNECPEIVEWSIVEGFEGEPCGVGFAIWNFNSEKFKVIGNIYENPELLGD